ncbi:hypothetical protein NHG32_07015 [Aerococcaceae bacterium NML191219]|nr:hypothetical protein [Aerococcaceae bacterium NML191219]
MSINRINMDVTSLAFGEAGERINAEMQKIAQNILDLNTEATKARKLVIEVEFKPNANRDALETSVQVTSKLVKQEKAVTTMLIGQDYKTGAIEMNELKSGTPGQMFFDPEDSQLKDDKGQAVEEIEKGKIIDYNKKKASN